MEHDPAAGPCGAYRGKRALDLALGLALMLATLPVLVLAALLVLVLDGGPALHVSTRVGRHGRAFRLLKLRTMRPDRTAEGVFAGHMTARVTTLGRHLRATRLDELPQLLQVVAGRMSLVGPRPPLERHLRARPDLLAPALRARPGITGLASVMFHAREERLLAAASGAEEAERIYLRRCLPRKAWIDGLHRRRAGPGADLYVLYLTLALRLPLPGRRAVRLRQAYRGTRPGRGQAAPQPAAGTVVRPA